MSRHVDPDDPIEPVDVGYDESPPTFIGLTKREFFAIHALKAMIESTSHNSARAEDKRTTCAAAVSYADALIDVLNKDQ